MILETFPGSASRAALGVPFAFSPAADYVSPFFGPLSQYDPLVVYLMFLPQALLLISLFYVSGAFFSYFSPHETPRPESTS